MLTADLVRATRRAGELKLSPLSGKIRARALELSELLLETALSHVGRTRDELKEAITMLHAEAGNRKLIDGLAKLVDDACEFGLELDVSPVELRTAVFEAATAAARALPPGAAFDRLGVLRAVAAQHDLTVEHLEGALFADLKGAHVLSRVEALTASSLVERYEVSQRQAVLLRAVRVRARVFCSRPEDYRRMFQALKFRRLLFRVEQAERGFRIELDGPYSLFESVTKYGINLALALPVLEQAEELELEADLRWGKAREALLFKYEARRSGAALAAQQLDEVEALAAAFPKLGSEWRLERADVLLEVPGMGVLFPDLKFTHPSSDEPVYFELLGFWSRAAVWKRIELAHAGLDAKILFAASQRLRVSEELLSDVESAALYLFKATLSPRAILVHLERLRAGA